MARPLTLAAAIVAALLAVSGAGGAPAQSPRAGGTLAFGGPFVEPACLTPFRTECGWQTSLPYSALSELVLRAPFSVGANLTWQPDLVARYELTTKPPFTLTYHIRPEARWSDGKPITAADFVFTHRASLRYVPPDTWNPDRTEVRSVSAVDAKTVRIVLRSRYAGWHVLIGTVLPAHALRGVDLGAIWRDGIVDPRSGAPIGSGPFLLQSWERGRQLTFRRNARWWGPHRPYLDRLLFRFVQGPALRDVLRSGALDVASHFPPGLATDLRAEPGVRVVTNQRAGGWDHLEFHLKGAGGNPALQSKAVRRALAFGIDRAAIVRRVLKRFDAHAAQRDSVVFATNSPSYRPNWNRYSHRPALARGLLERAGCKLAPDGIYVCGAQRLSFELLTPITQGGFRPEVAELIKSQLREIGIEIRPAYSSSAIFGPLAAGKFDIAFFAWVGGPETDGDAKAIFGCGASLNWTGYCQRLVTEDLDEAQRTLDPRRQARVLNRADARIANDVPVLPLYQQTQSVAVRTSVRGVSIALNHQLEPLWKAEDWWLDR